MQRRRALVFSLTPSTLTVDLLPLLRLQLPLCCSYVDNLIDRAGTHRAWRAWDPTAAHQIFTLRLVVQKSVIGSIAFALPVSFGVRLEPSSAFSNLSEVVTQRAYNI